MVWAPTSPGWVPKQKHNRVFHHLWQMFGLILGPRESESGLKAWHATGNILAVPPKHPTIKICGPFKKVPCLFERIQCSACLRGLTTLNLIASLATGLDRKIFHGGGFASTSRKRWLRFIFTEEIEKRLVSFPNIYAGKSRLSLARVSRFWCSF